MVNGWGVKNNLCGSEIYNLCHVWRLIQESIEIIFGKYCKILRRLSPNNPLDSFVLAKYRWSFRDRSLFEFLAYSWKKRMFSINFSLILFVWKMCYCYVFHTFLEIILFTLRQKKVFRVIYHKKKHVKIPLF